MNNFEIENRYLANTYQKRNIEIIRGSGAFVYDSLGSEYIDCITGNGVALLGHSHPNIINAISEQIQKIITCPGILYSDVRAQFLEKLAEISPIKNSRIFLSNSGTESVECALKLARKFTGKTEIIAMQGGFHGRTYGSLSATWKPKYRKGFEPLVPGFSHVEFGNIEQLSNAINENTAAVILEAVQGEAGVIIPSRNYLQEVQELCNEKNILLILDEVQTFGKTGNFFACETFGITPDILCAAKGLAGGVPIGATIAREEIFSSIKIGEHASTFGGNPLACAAGIAIIETLKKENLIERGAEMGNLLIDSLKELETLEFIREVRGIGAMIAIESRFEVKAILQNCLENGVLIQTSGRNTLRFLPPLVINREQVEKISEIVKNSVRKFGKI